MELFANVVPVQKAQIPWGWTNRKTEHGLFVVKSPGKIRMPRLAGFFDWRQFVVEDMAPDLEFGTRNMKSVFTTAARFMGWENLLVECPPLAPITDGFIEWNARLLEVWGPRLRWFMIGDDIAYDRGLLIRPDWWREWVRPEQERLVRFAKDRGLRVVFHSDGDLCDVLDDFEEMGVDVLHCQRVGRMKELLGGGSCHYRRMRLVENTEPTRPNAAMMALQESAG